MKKNNRKSTRGRKIQKIQTVERDENGDVIFIKDKIKKRTSIPILGRYKFIYH